METIYNKLLLYFPNGYLYLHNIKNEYYLFWILFTVTITDLDHPRNSIPIPSIDLNMSQYNEEMQKMHITINTETDEPPDEAPKMFVKFN